MKNFTLLTLLLVFMTSVSAQELLTPSFSFSKKKTSYVTLENGTEIKGNITDLDYKKGLIKQIKIVDGTGTKHKLKPSSVKYMYLMPSGFSKLNKAIDFVNNAQRWNNEKLDQDILNQGYVYFETVNVKIKKKSMPMLMQLLNPSFSKSVKVYHDPYAKESASIGVGNVKVAGGLAKSYFVMLDTDNAAHKLEKKKYKKSYVALWDKCNELSSMEEVSWKDFTNHVIKFTECAQ